MKFREATKSGFRQKDLEHEKKESCVLTRGASQVVPVIKNLPAHAGDIRDTGFNPWVAKVLLEEGMATHFSILA